MATLTNAELITALTGLHGLAAPSTEPGLRFAFYGRMSTSLFQDVQTSRAWQRAVSDELIDGVGSVVAEFLRRTCLAAVEVAGPSAGRGVAGRRRGSWL